MGGHGLTALVASVLTGWQVHVASVERQHELEQTSTQQSASWDALQHVCEDHATRANECTDERRALQQRHEACLAGRVEETE